MSCQAKGLTPISTHAPYVRGDRKSMVVSPGSVYFNPRPVCTGRPVNKLMGFETVVFQPTPRMYGATGGFVFDEEVFTDFNPRPVCTGRLACNDKSIRALLISTHAPYVRGDKPGEFVLATTLEISTHAPYVRGD